jgi:hypothetical protein
MANVLRVLGGVVVAAGVYASLSGTATAQDAQTTLTGCLRAGSANAVYVLRGATGGEGQIARDYLLVQAPADIGDRVNRRLAITGTVHAADAGPAAPEGANSAERALRRLAVSAVQEVASNCD